MTSAYVAFDCESSGLDPASDSLLQLAAVRIREGEVEGEFASLVRYTQPLSLGVARLTGLVPGDLAVAPPLREAIDGFRAFAGELPLVAHNAPFDVAFLQAALKKCGLPPWAGTAYDTYSLARLLAPLQPSFRLGELAARYGLALQRAHDALHDARAAGLLFAALQAALAEVASPMLATLEFLQRPAGDATWSLLAEALAARGGGLVQPVLAAAVTGRGGAATAEPAAGPPALDLRRFDADELAGALAPGGVMARSLPGYEPRPGQVAMLQAVARAFASGRHLLVEAGTGTGKSLAYLLPALAWARVNEVPVVIATHTVNLQEQLIEKDIPLVAAALNTPVRATLLKGRGHYLCLKTWSETLQEQPAADDAPFLARVAAWLGETVTGDRGELDLFGEDEERWYGLSTDAVACTGRRCPWYDRCFLFRARTRADASEVVVVNHALLLSDLKMGSHMLPEHRHLVVDEAHHLDEEASNHLGATLSERRLLDFLSGLDRSRGRGVLGALRRSVQAGGDLAFDLSSHSSDLARVLARVQGEVAAALAGAAEAFGGWRDWARPRVGRGGGGWATVRMEPREDGWAEVAEAGGRLREQMATLQRSLGDLAHEVEDDPLLGGVGSSAATAAEVAESSARAGEFAAGLQLLLTGAPGWVTWLEASTRRAGALGAVTLRAAPIEPGPLLADGLFAARDSVVLTSATLAVAGSFQYVAGRLGLLRDRERYDAVAVASPFDFKDQALLAIVDDLPDAREQDAYGKGLTAFLGRLLTASGGRGLVLFTSNRMLRSVYSALKPVLEASGIAVLGQGLDGSRGRLAAALRENAATVVLGAASFWEGIDVPGDALSCVVVAQLPFWAPDIPLVAARSEAVAAAGLSPFRDLALPQAALRFKQGFGRLIRTGADRGVAVVCDRRLAKSDYGKVFLSSLPGPRVFVGGQDRVLERAAGFLGQG